MALVEKGFNSDVSVRGSTFHVQTEDWGHEARLIVTKVFRNGAVVKSFKVPYSDVLKFQSHENTQALRLVMREQHQRILDLLSADQL